MGDGGTDLALDVVANDRNASFFELVVPLLGSGDENGQGVDESDLRVNARLRVVFGGFLRANRQVAHQDVDLFVTQNLCHVYRFFLRLFDRFEVVLAQTVQSGSTFHRHTSRRHVGNFDGVVFAGQDRVSDVLAHLLRIYIEGGDEFEVADVIVTELDMHETWNLFVRLSVPVVFDSLNEGSRAVSEPCDGYANWVSHCALTLL